MGTRVVRASRSALLIGGTVVVVAACGSGGSAPTSTRPAAPETGSGSGSASASGAIVSTASIAGASRLVSADGHTLYEARGESPGHLLCVGACTRTWKPVAASDQQAQRAGSALGQSFTVVGRPGGGTQLVYAGHPVYVLTREGPHQLRGDGVADEFHGTHLEWSAATLGGSPVGSPGARPSMGSKPSDAGAGGH